MNVIGAGLIDSIGLASLTADVSALVADTDTATSITWHNASERAADFGAGEVSYSEAATSISAWLSDLTLDRKAPADAQAGDVQVLIRASDLTVPPTTSSRFTAGTVSYSVYRVVSGPVSTHYLVYAHRS